MKMKTDRPIGRRNGQRPHRPATPSRAGVDGSFAGNVAGGLTAALLGLPGNMVCGLIAFAPMGPRYASFGIVSAMLVSVATGVIAGLLGSVKGMITAPQVATAVVFASVIERALDSGAFRLESPADASALLVLAFITVFCSGLAQVLLSFFRAGKLIRYIPYPVIAGFFNGTAVLIIWGQVKPFLRLARAAPWNAPSVAGILDYFGGWSAVQLEITLAVFLFSVVAGALFKKLPIPLFALFLGTLAYYGLEYALFPAEFHSAMGNLTRAEPRLALGFIATIPAGIVRARATQAWPLILKAALSIAVIGSLNSLFAGIAHSATVQRKYQGNRDLFAQGVANAGAALLGALPGELSLSRTMNNYRAGGLSFLSVVAHSATVAAFVLFLGTYLSAIPRPVISGILLHTGVRLVDPWSLTFFGKLFTSKMRDKKEILTNVIVMGAVIAITVVVDLVSAVLVGLALAMIIVLGQMREDVVRRSYTGRNVRSQKRRDPDIEELLGRLGQSLSVIELEGPLFFGSAVTLSERLDSLVEGGSRFAIIDFRRVTRVDVSSVRMLVTSCRKLTSSGTAVYLCATAGTDGIGLYFNDFSVRRELAKIGVRHFVDLDRALEAAEEALLASEQVNTARATPVPLAEALRRNGIKDDRGEGLADYFFRIEVKGGENLFAAGDAGDSLYFIESGEMELLVARAGTRGVRRVGVLGPGNFVGEIAFLSGEPQETTARSVDNSVCYRLSRPQYSRAQKKIPEQATRLASCLYAITAKKLRQAYDLVSKAE